MRIECTSELNVKVVFTNTSISEITLPAATIVRAFTKFYKMNMNVLLKLMLMLKSNHLQVQRARAKYSSKNPNPKNEE